MGLQSKPFNLKQLTDGNCQHQNERNLQPPHQTQIEFQMIRQLAGRLQQMSDLMRQLVQTMEQANLQFNRSIQQMNRINHQNNNTLNQYFQLEANFMQLMNQPRNNEESMQDMEEQQQRQSQTENQSQKQNTKTFIKICKFGLAVAVPIATIYIYRSLPSNIVGSVLSTAKRTFLNLLFNLLANIS